MSTEIYIQGFKGAQSHGIEASRVLSTFGKHKSDQKDGFYSLNYDNINFCDFTISEERDLVTGVCIFRPCAHTELYQSIFDLLQIGPYVAFTPGGKSPVVGYPEIEAELPSDMIAALGKPVQVQIAGDIPATLFG